MGKVADTYFSSKKGVSCTMGTISNLRMFWARDQLFRADIQDEERFSGSDRVLSIVEYNINRIDLNRIDLKFRTASVGRDRHRGKAGSA